ncbi:hypothetical protein DPMN_157668 [Dreissena polymorpha]|uniref:Uncharacterized protein n=1 Tax=Dreissena polymorpha TaxID=45954 RepID=A0A9D4EHQ4_DREPO|nr:hypothetical protein DPMN_157668 [Dreissena polymorpha]
MMKCERCNEKLVFGLGPSARELLESEERIELLEVQAFERAGGYPECWVDAS